MISKSLPVAVDPSSGKAASALPDNIPFSNGPNRRLVGVGLLGENPTFEKHYRIGDLARMWGLGRETVRKLIKDDPGVIKVRLGRKKAHTIYSVPESAAQRIHKRLLNAV